MFIVRQTKSHVGGTCSCNFFKKGEETSVCSQHFLQKPHDASSLSLNQPISYWQISRLVCEAYSHE